MLPEKGSTRCRCASDPPTAAWNAHEYGLGEQWDSAKAYWADPTDDKRAELPDWLNFGVPVRFGGPGVG
ncbi:hypothetical protein AB0M79_29050 [Polymorphospora sp. NPDC051019]|uniref:hypothetical protein n=1 Tax=Polymorphospora sp. NPDC051019 TaxID=3155725 RepID=UPI00342AB775